MKLDQIDWQLLNLLQADCKLTNKELANRVHLSTTAIFERIKKLEKEGIIDKYVALVNRSKVEKAFVVFCHVKLVKHSQQNVMEFEREVVSLEEVLECYHVSGDYDYLLKVHVKDIEAFREFMVRKLTSISRIGSTHSMFMISEVKHTTAITP